MKKAIILNCVSKTKSENDKELERLGIKTEPVNEFMEVPVRFYNIDAIEPNIRQAMSTEGSPEESYVYIGGHCFAVMETIPRIERKIQEAGW